MTHDRLVISAKDIQCITGRSERSAERMLMTIKEKLGKQKHQFVTCQEFCEYAGLSVEQVQAHIRNGGNDVL